MSRSIFHPANRERDPHRALGLAIRSTRQLGVISLVVGVIVAIGPGLLNPLRFKWYILGAAVLVLIAPGSLYLFALRPLREKRMGALVAVATAAGLQALAAAALLAVQLFLRPISLVPVVLAALWAVAMTQVLLHLRQTFNAIRYDSTGRVRGFEVAMPSPPAVQLSASPDDDRENRQ